MAEEITYKSINDLDKTNSILLNSYFLISEANTDSSEFVSKKATVLLVADLLSSYLSVLVPTGFKQLAYLDKADIERNGNYPLNSYVYWSEEKTSFPPEDGISEYNGYAISSIVFERGRPIRANYVNINDYKTKIEDVITTGEEIAKLDTISIKNGIEIFKETNSAGITTTTLRNNGKDTVISPGIPNIELLTYADDGDVIAVFKKLGESDLSIKNNLNVIPVGYRGTSDKNGDLIATIKFSDHDVLLYNNLCVTQEDTRGNVVATINGKNIYNGINIGTNDIGYVTTLNGLSLSGYTPVTVKTTDGDIIANIAGRDIKNGVPVTNYSNTGERIAYIKDTIIRNGITITNNTDSKGIVTTVINNNGKEYVVGSGIASTSIDVKSTVGTVIAEIQLTGSAVKQIRNGFDELSLLKKIYPVGSVYLTMSNENPLTTFGFGLWSKISQGRCLWGSNDTYAAGSTLNSALPSLPTITASTSINSGTATINGTTSANGSHTHIVSGSTSAAGEHTHTISVGAGSCSCGTKKTVGNSHVALNWTPSTGSAGNHTHNIAVSCGTTDNHNHTFSGSANITGASCNTNVNIGASDYYGKSTVVLPPAFIVNIWQRVS